MNLWILLQGFGFGATMIIPIGAQNAYVLNQGIKRNHHLTTATICS
ncbi:amino acid transporter, partial [Vibrio furnissii]